MGDQTEPVTTSDTLAKSTTMLPQLKRLDKKTSDTNAIYYEETAPPADVPDQLNWWETFALCLVRDVDLYGRVGATSLRINSPRLKRALLETIVSYPGLSFATKEVSIPRPYHALYHYREELAEVTEKAQREDEKDAEHLKLLMEFMDEEFKELTQEANNLIDQKLTSYDLAWTLFRPGTMVRATILGQERVFSVTSYTYGRCALDLVCEFFDFDGESFGTRSQKLSVFDFGGTRPIMNLEACPLPWLPDEEALKQRLVERGRAFERLAGMHFQMYKGIGLESTPYGMSRYSVDGRIVVDTATFHRLNANLAFSVNVYPTKEVTKGKGKRRRAKQAQIGFAAMDYDDLDFDEAGNEIPSQPSTELLPDEQPTEHAALNETQCLLASATVRGFSFTEKRWLAFFVNNLSPIEWDPHCFDHLVLPSAQKELVRALVATHIQERVGFTDIVKGKGRGLVMLLHGPPGVGKTLTAETVAEYCKRPLYSVSSGDLGINSETLDERLSRILDMASTWKAVLLIDEADVFLEQRSLHDLKRNSLVSIFLRVLEYYQGILFLTTNRVSTFDAAFKSRISVPLKYSELTAESRLQIWQHFLARIEGGCEIDEQGYKDLSQALLNGRQIKNVIKTAESLARFHKQKLDVAMLKQVVGIQMEFEAELGAMDDEPTTGGAAIGSS